MPTYSSASAACSRTYFSSWRTGGVRKIEPNSPAFMRLCWPIMTFSSADIVPKRRMFWNVRAMPSFMILSGRPAVMFAPSKETRPSVGL